MNSLTIPGTIEKRELPPSWETIALEEISILNPKFNQNDLSDHTQVSFVPMRVVEAENGKVSLSQTKQIKQVKKGYTFFTDGDILFAKITPCMENGKIAIVDRLANGIGFGSTEFHVIRVFDNIERKYLFYYLVRKEFRTIAQVYMTGSAGQLRVPKRFLQAVEIPIPPLPEQHRIVAKIEALFSLLDAGVAELKRIQAQLQTYRQAVLKAAFEGKLTAEWRAAQNSPLRRGAGGDVNTPENAQTLIQQIQTEREHQYQEALKKSLEAGTPKPKRPKPLSPVDTSELPELPEGWVWEKLGNVVTDMCLGKMLDKSKNKGIPKPYLRNVNVRWGNFDLDDLKLMRFEVDENERYGIIADDLIICEGGEPGRAAIWKDQIPNMMIQKALHRVRFNNDFISGRYVLNFLYLSSKNGHLSSFFTGTTIKHLTGKGLSEFSLPITHISEQNQIVQEIESRLSVADNLEQTITTALQQAEALRQSILKKAFAGELVPQDPNDEPAEALLARIREEKENLETAAKAVKKSKKSPPSKGGKGGC